MYETKLLFFTQYMCAEDLWNLPGKYLNIWFILDELSPTSLPVPTHHKIYNKRKMNLDKSDLEAS